MKSILSVACCFVILFFLSYNAQSQLYKIDLNRKIDKAALVIEGKVISQNAFWNTEHTLIYTASKIHVYKLFKGRLVSAEIEVITQGGAVGNKCLKVSDVLQLRKDEKGMFFLQENAQKIKSAFTKNILFDVYSSEQGFLRYDEENKVAFAPFARYENIEQTLYNLVRQHTGIKEKVLDKIPQVNSGNASNGTAGTLGGTITSFSPSTVHGGAINDPANNLLTISGSGFGNNPSGSAGIKFKDANNDNSNPDYKIDYNSPYIISWADNQITVNVPDRAGTGRFAVVTNDGTSALSSSSLNVFFSVLDAEFELDNGDIFVREPRLMNTNSSGGYNIEYSTSTAGGGKNFTASPAKETFERALATWKEITGANLSIGTPTTIQKIEDDEHNIVVYDNNNLGSTIPHMADGVLESTYSWFSACTQGTQLLTAQKTGFDIILRNPGVSLGSTVSFENGPCFPVVGTYDLEMIILHELGHALNLSHINDDYEDGGTGYFSVNPSKLMHYAILDFVDRRSPDASAYQGVLYTITPQGNIYGNCGLFSSEMSLLSPLAISNDECPSTFPATEIQDNTIVNIDLVHATSNKFADPSFQQVICSGGGTSVTNNAYYAFMNGTKTDLQLSIKNYTSVPSQSASCNGQSIRISLYDVSNCPAAQSYPLPVACSNFSNDKLIAFNSLKQNHKYLLYFDGFRNTKASFNIIFNGDSTIQPGTTTEVTVFPNPVNTGILTVKITNTSGTFYEYALFDVAGRLLATNKVSVSLPVQTIPIEMSNMASGVYFLKIVDANGKKVATKKILKVNK